MSTARGQTPGYLLAVPPRGMTLYFLHRGTRCAFMYMDMHVESARAQGSASGDDGRHRVGCRRGSERRRARARAGGDERGRRARAMGEGEGLCPAPRDRVQQCGGVGRLNSQLGAVAGAALAVSVALVGRPSCSASPCHSSLRHSLASRGVLVGTDAARKGLDHSVMAVIVDSVGCDFEPTG